MRHREPKQKSGRIFSLRLKAIAVVVPILIATVIISGNVSAVASVRTMTRMGHLSGEIEQHERELIEGAFTLDTRQVWEVMTPRVDIFAWEDSLTLADIAQDLRRCRPGVCSPRRGWGRKGTGSHRPRRCRDHG